MKASVGAVEAARNLKHAMNGDPRNYEINYEIAAEIIEKFTQVSELRRVLKLANDFIVNGVEYQAGHYEAETVHHEMWAVLEGKG